LLAQLWWAGRLERERLSHNPDLIEKIRKRSAIQFRDQNVRATCDSSLPAFNT
jgi:hypothetical protein